MPSTVFFASARVRKWKYEDSLPGKLERLLHRAGLGARFGKGDVVAVKTHFGSEGAHRIVRPIFLRKIVDALKAHGAKPFVTDTTRIKGIDYLEVANQNGINHASVGAPVVIGDGIFGHDNILINAEGLGDVAVASAIHDAPGMIVVSHSKGHINSGYAGAIKNLAMGGVSGSHRKCGWKCGRGAMHSIGEGMLHWKGDACTLCYQCAEVCPLSCIAFTHEGKVFGYDPDRCWRCGRCVRVCPAGALAHEGADAERFIKSLAWAAKAVLGTFSESRKVLYINFILEVQPECDCMPGADVPVVQDQGILLSDDLAAIEQASLDMISKASPLPQSAASDMNIKPGEDVLMRLHERPAQVQIDECVRMGLGTRDYELVDISAGPDQTPIRFHR